MLTRRGQLAWIFMSLIAVALVVVAFFILASFRGTYGDISQQFAALGARSIYSQSYAETSIRFITARAIVESDPRDFARSFNATFVRLMNDYDPGDGRFGTFFGVVRTGRYTLDERAGVYTLTLPSIEQRSSVEHSSFSRNFSLNVRFTPSGLL